MEKKNKRHSISLPFLLAPIYVSLFYFHTTLVAAYKPTTPITLNCGSARESSARDNRRWAGDVGTNFTSQNQNDNASVTATSLQGSSVDPVPYSTARIFTSQFTYSFFLPTGPKFVRFHFYPSLYKPQFDATKQFFSVEVGNYTVFSNFSAYLHALDQKWDSVFKEFCFNVQEENRWLNVTFIPLDDGFAFVNGIEIVSMPDFLYYTRNLDTGIQIVGQKTASLPLENTTALETIYRLNVGGGFIASVDDSGMFRSWFSDNDFLGLFPGIELSNMSIQIKYSEKYPAYLAPDEVYQTFRSMGPNRNLNVITNLTWALPVNLGFNYLIRLHFCEVFPEITEFQDREFHIDINGLTAEEQADVIGWSGQNGAAAYRDYVVLVQDGGSKQILVTMHPNPKFRTRYSDTILNGIELFKLSNATWSLAGPNPEPNVPTTPPLSPQLPPREKKKWKAAVIIAVGSIFGSVVVVFLLIFFLVRRRRTSMARKKEKSNGTKSLLHSSSLPTDLCHRFSIVEIRQATDNFNDVFRIGVGGFGNVYKGYMEADESNPVAIKRLNPDSQQGAHEFHTEIQMLSRLRHFHLVSLIGYCDDDQEMILVYDYMAHGTLRDHLYKTDNPPLTWNQRLEMCIGAARGLHYLHTGAMYSIIHRDVKTTNILLDEKWVAKVADFGLSRLGPTNPSANHVSTVVKGSFGYMDPEYFLRQQLTEKSDVYSFGVVLFEVLCARPPLVQTAEKGQVNLADWARNCYQNGTLGKIVDRHLTGKIASECLKKFGELAVSCVHDEGIQRPSMNDVVWTLEFVLELQRSAEERIRLGLPQPEEKEETDEKITNYSSTLNGSDLFSGDEKGGSDSTSSGPVTTVSNGGVSSASSNSERAMVGAVFSEIMNSKGR